MRKPDFFMVGAPKCGTTAMYEFLAQHPEIFLPKTKEIHFFGTDLYSPNYGRELEKYLSLFAGARDKKRVGEASVWYLYSKRASAEIKQFSPSASIIVMLRNPVEMIHSLHSHRLYIGTEDIEDFSEALDAEHERKLGARLPRNPYPIGGLFYREVGSYAAQVQRYFDAFGTEKVKVIIFDDFKADPARASREVFDFLGVSPSFAPRVRVINPNKKVRSKTVRDFLDQPPPSFLRRLARPLTTPQMRHRLFQAFRRLNTDYVPRSPIPDRLRLQLQAYFASDVQRVSEMLDRDLTYWCQPSGKDH
jgi:hypothetical protein